MIWQELLELYTFLAERYGEINASIISVVFSLLILHTIYAILKTLFIFWQSSARTLDRLIKHLQKTARPTHIKNAEVRLLERRRRFAIYVQSQIEQLNSQEAWSDYRFAELEAEIEIEGRYRSRDSLRRPREDGLYRVHSLTAALETSLEPFILLEGDPGAGKSVALRQVGLNLVRRAKVKDSNEEILPIPLYINLKELDRHKLKSINPSIDIASLRRMLSNIFNLEELRLLCYDLGIQYEDLPGSTLSSKSAELVAYCQRHSLVGALLDACRHHRPYSNELATFFPLPSIDQDLIRQFVLFSLNRVNDRDIEVFLEETFDQGMRENHWLFLFDSFDEIPEVLGATDAFTVIQQYGDAISNFLSGMNACRGIVASRQYRGPKQFSCPRFRVLPLKRQRQEELVRKSQLNEEGADNLLAHLHNAPSGMQTMATNPLFLSLLCEYTQRTQEFPPNTHAVYEEYINNRLERDRYRLRERFNLRPEQVRDAAERVAFAMMADEPLGLSPTRSTLRAAITRLDLVPSTNFDTLLDSLEFLKLARTEMGESNPDSRSFTFSHRRFQEYFATSVVLREPSRTSPYQLLTDGRWRETAVVLCQTQPIEALNPLIVEANILLSEMVASISKNIPHHRSSSKETFLPSPFPWSANTLHLLGILQEGFASRLDTLPGTLKRQVGSILWLAYQTGMHFDKLWSLEVASISPQPILLSLIQLGLLGSRKQRDLAYQQIARLRLFTDDVQAYIFKTLAQTFVSGRLYKERHIMHAFLSRLQDGDRFIVGMNLLLRLYRLDFYLHLAFSLLILFISPFSKGAWSLILSFLLMGGKMA